MWDYIVKSSSILGFVGSLITLCFNIFITRKTKKENARVYFDTQALTRNVLVKFDKEDYKNGAKLYLTDKYNDLIESIKVAHKENLKTADIDFLEIENMSSNPCFGMKVKFSLKSNSGKEEFEEIDIYTMKGNEIVIIPFIHDGGYETNILEIIYNTLESETMKYECITRYKGKKVGTDQDDVEVTQTVYRKNWLGIYQKLFSTLGSGVGSYEKIK